MKRRQDGSCEETVTIGFSEADAFGRCKASTLLRRFGDLADADYAARGLTHERLASEGYVFLLSRIRLELLRGIHSGETLTLRTAERGAEGPFCDRGYLAFDAAERPVALGRAFWLLCDPATRRIHKPDSFPYAFSSRQDFAAACQTPGRIRIPGSMQPVGERRIVYSDLDGNGHTNNAVYADIACDVLPLALPQQGLRDLQLQYVREAKYGETLSLYTHTESGTAYVEGRIGDETCFTAALRFFDDTSAS